MKKGHIFGCGNGFVSQPMLAAQAVCNIVSIGAPSLARGCNYHQQSNEHTNVYIEKQLER
jgi:hypothetical protein